MVAMNDITHITVNTIIIEPLGWIAPLMNLLWELVTHVDNI